MKKLFSIMIAITMILACVFSVGAYSLHGSDSDDFEEIKVLETELNPLFSDYFYEKTGDDTFRELSVVQYGTLGDAEEEYVLVSFIADSAVKKDVMYRLDEFAVVSQYESPLFIDGMAVYTKSDGLWHPFSYIYEKDINEFAFIMQMHQTPALVGTLSWFLSGDDYNIEFATTIQKFLANMDIGITIDETCYLDFDNDGDVTIKDATAIQKYIAGLEY